MRKAQHRLGDVGESGDAAAAVGAELAVVFRLHFARCIFFDIAARHDPVAALGGEAGANVNVRVRVGIGAGGVVHPDARFATFEIDLAHGDLDAGAATRADLDLAASANGAGGDTDFELAVDVGHALSLRLAEGARLFDDPSTCSGQAATPSADANRFRFDGSGGAYPAPLSESSLPGDEGGTSSTAARTQRVFSIGTDANCLVLQRKRRTVRKERRADFGPTNKTVLDHERVRALDHVDLFCAARRFGICLTADEEVARR